MPYSRGRDFEAGATWAPDDSAITLDETVRSSLFVNLLTEANLTEWVTFAQAQDADRDDGLVFMDIPLEVK